METLQMSVELRRTTGKGSAHKSRARGMAPGVVYGPGIEPFAISFNPANLRSLLKSGHGVNSVLSLSVSDGRLVTAMVKDMQIDPLSRNIIHGDFIAINENTPVTVKVPLHFEGRSEGVKAGGVLIHLAREVTLRCLPKDIPHELKVDITPLKIGDSLHFSELKTPEGAQVVFKVDRPVAYVEK